LQDIYRAIDELEPIEQDKETFRPVKSLYYWPLAIAFVLSLLLSASHPVILSWLARVRFQAPNSVKPKVSG
ncbi:MAG: hypothetical protein KDI36_18615, partial [Pseudomonadales bacterium]|nr:hypothetical protein [Pseudomonadales bacterium]